jgi:hypothetical protein
MDTPQYFDRFPLKKRLLYKAISFFYVHQVAHNLPLRGNVAAKTIIHTINYIYFRCRILRF